MRICIDIQRKGFALLQARVSVPDRFITLKRFCAEYVPKALKRFTGEANVGLLPMTGAIHALAI